jgi:UDP-N-acetylmuramyl tripeptide synthase
VVQHSSVRPSTHTEARPPVTPRSGGPPAPRRRLPARTRFAVSAGRAAAWLSRRTGLGGGGVIGGRVTLWLDSQALRRLAGNRQIVLVTGTNGKTTTSLMVSRIFEALAPVAANRDGANMPDGVLAALADEPEAPYAVLEVDETYLGWVAERVRPAALVLLNLSRDQLDRVGEVRTTERELRAAVSALPDSTVVANCDDVLVTSAAQDAGHPVWVGTGGTWFGDSMSCPRCGGHIRHTDDHWTCGCGLARPEPDWALSGDRLTMPGGGQADLDLRLPGAANQSNAAVAVATSAALGVAVPTALDQLRTITDVAGRYRTTQWGEHSVHLMLAKNPAGWSQTLPLLASRSGPVVIAINAREADGRDLSWLWDVSFEHLRGREVVAAGERSADLSVRLRYAEIDHERVADPLGALGSLPHGKVELVANYTAFRDLAKRFEHAHG